MKLTIESPSNLDSHKTDLLVTCVFSPLSIPSEWMKLDIKSSAESEGFSAKMGQVFSTQTFLKKGPKSIALLGLGEKEKSSTDTLRKAGGLTFRLAGEKRCKNLSILFNDDKEALQAYLEGFYMAQYRFDKYLTENKTEKYLESITFLSKLSKDDLKKQSASALAIAESVCYARDLINEGPLVMNPEEMAKRAKREAKELGLSIDILDENKLEKEKMGLILGVARGALKSAPPRLIRLAYRPEKKHKKHVVLVGKGVTFDSGGLDLKPSAGMLDMKIDMSGAACVFGTMMAIAKFKPSVAVTGYMVCVENAIGSNAFHPGDILLSRKGLSVEINNTDAEGRLILADALDYAQEREKPDLLIDLATLTGACMVALGPTTAGLFSKNEGLTQDLLKAGKKVGEDYWHMPLNDDLADQLKSPIADLKNSGERYGGSITAALFLQRFVKEKTAWAHLDIAGPASNEKDHPYIPKGGAGFGVRTLVELITHL